ncbi:MAG: hypothetical protein LBG21_07300 [Campylobacteraceae bacterium]|nr:hypothetical protein [Campylobacteraceae bacterium]
MIKIDLIASDELHSIFINSSKTEILRFFNSNSVDINTNLVNFYAQTNADYLVVDFLSINIKLKNKGSINRQILKDHFSASNSKYLKVFILVDRIIERKTDFCFWLIEEMNAAIRCIGKTKDIIVPIRYNETLVADDQKYVAVFDKLLNAIEKHYIRIPNYEVKTTISRNVISAEIIGSFRDMEVTYTYYVMRYGMVYYRLNSWCNSRNFSYELTESGVYTILAFVTNKAKTSKIIKSSLPMLYFMEKDLKDYMSFINNYKYQTKFITEELPFYSLSDTQCDFALVSSKNVANNFDLNGLNNFSQQTFGDMRGCKTLLITNGKLRGNGENQFLFSGYAVVNENIIFDIKDPKSIRTRAGCFYCVFAEKERVKIIRDNCGFNFMFYYQSEDITVVANRYHLILLILKKLMINLSLDFNTSMIKFCSSRTQMFSQHIGLDMDICGVKSVPIWKDAAITKNGFELTDNELGKGLTQAKVFHMRDYFIMFKRAKREILSNSRTIINWIKKQNMEVIFDITGGLDSRCSFAALVSLNSDMSKVRLNVNDTGNDLLVANTINTLFDIPWNNVGEKRNRFSIWEGDKNIRSFYLGTYYCASAINTEYEKNNRLYVCGACGEISRPYVAHKYLDTNFDDISDLRYAVKYIASDLAIEMICDTSLSKHFVEKYLKVLDEVPLGGYPLKMLYHYFTTRHSYHFSYAYTSNRIIFSSLDSLSLFIANVISLPVFNSCQMQFDLLASFSREMIDIPFDNPKYNEDLNNLGDLLIQKHKVSEYNQDMNAWKNAKQKQVKDTITYLQPNYNQEEEIKYNVDRLKVLYDALWYCIQKISGFDETWKSIWLYLLEYQDDEKMTRRVTEIYNKVLSTAEQLKIIESHDLFKIESNTHQTDQKK